MLLRFLYQPHQVLRIGLVATLLHGHLHQVVVPREVAECGVKDHEPPVLKPVQQLLKLPVERIKLLKVHRAVRPVVVLMRGIDLHQSFADLRHHYPGILNRKPDMRVRSGMMVAIARMIVAMGVIVFIIVMVTIALMIVAMGVIVFIIVMVTIALMVVAMGVIVFIIVMVAIALMRVPVLVVVIVEQIDARSAVHDQHVAVSSDQTIKPCQFELNRRANLCVHRSARQLYHLIGGNLVRMR